MPVEGDTIPPFEARTARYDIFHFPHDLQMSFTILVVYRKNACVPCKVQLKYLRDAYAAMLVKGAQIIAISFPPPEESAQIAIELKLPYQILCDPEGVLLTKLGTINVDKLASGGIIYSGLIFPTIFIVDRKGVILFKLVTKKTATPQEFTQVYTTLERLKKQT